MKFPSISTFTSHTDWDLLVRDKYLLTGVIEC